MSKSISLPGDREQAGGTWQGTSVDVAAIETALAGLWKRAGQGTAEGGRHLPIRTSVMNLVVYVARDADAARAVDAIAALTERHPSRTICLLADPNAPTSSLDAQVTSQCREENPYGCLCWEQITITAHGAAAAHVPGVVIPLLLPDLPVYLWWTGDVAADMELFRRMVDLCDRLIVDSSTFTRPIDGLVQLAAIKRSMADDRGAGDFHWMRLTPWRNLAAQFFDGAERRPYADAIDGVRLGYAHGAHTRRGVAQALLLAGWLTSSLGWSPRPAAARRRGDTLHLEADRAPGGAPGTVSIEVEPRPVAAADADDLIALTMTATLHDAPGVFAIERHARSSEATTTTTIGGAEPVARTVRMVTRTWGDLLREELEIYRHDRIYEAALATAAALAQRLVSEQGQAP